jgi:hypothetical protein
MTNKNATILTKTAIRVTALIGFILVFTSIFFNSSIMVLFGFSSIFWSILLSYVTPQKHVPLTYLNTLLTSQTQNIERLLTGLNLSQKAIYLPPRNLKEIESSLIFIPQTSQIILPTLEGASQTFQSNQKNGVLLTPPGIGLTRLLEKEYGSPFTKMDTTQLKQILPKLFVDNLELAENIEITTEQNKIIIQTTRCILDPTCKDTENQPKTHTQVGCILTSALACILAKTTGKPTTIDQEQINQELKPEP